MDELEKEIEKTMEEGPFHVEDDDAKAAPGYSQRSTFHQSIGVNSAVGKASFLLFVILGFFIVFQFGVAVIAWSMSGYNSTSTLIHGMASGKELLVFPQDPSKNTASPIFRSVNQKDGIEFTWTSFVYIDNLQYNDGKYRCIFYKGDSSGNPSDTSEDGNGLNFPNNAPGLYISPNSNELIVRMNTFDVINDQVSIPNIPIKKWMHIAIRVTGEKLDVFVNGLLAKRYELHGTPRQNYGNVYVGANGGFDGYVSRLQYHNKALSAVEISNSQKMGPNLTMDTDVLKIKRSNYLSNRWYVSA